MKHSKQKGNLGYSSTIKELHKLGVNVFVELGDYSKVDLIAEFEKTLIKIQVKYATETEGFVTIPLRKCGPNGYKYVYAEDDIDIFSVYLPIKDKVIFVPSKLACKNKNSFSIRFDDSKNKQQGRIHFIREFENLEKILRDISLGL
jgi:hypothetical protein